MLGYEPLECRRVKRAAAGGGSGRTRLADFDFEAEDDGPQAQAHLP
jgi:hypothetical protein